MKAYEIKYHLARAGHNIRSIAEDIGVTSPAVSQVIHGKDSSRRISEAIARAIGMPVGQVFPKYSQSLVPGQMTRRRRNALCIYNKGRQAVP